MKLGLLKPPLDLEGFSRGHGSSLLTFNINGIRRGSADINWEYRDKDVANGWR